MFLLNIYYLILCYIAIRFNDFKSIQKDLYLYHYPKLFLFYLSYYNKKMLRILHIIY